MRVQVLSGNHRTMKKQNMDDNYSSFLSYTGSKFLLSEEELKIMDDVMKYDIIVVVTSL